MFFRGENIYLRWFEFVFIKKSYFHQIHINICPHTLFLNFKFEWKYTLEIVMLIVRHIICLVFDFYVYLLCKIARVCKLSFPVHMTSISMWMKIKMKISSTSWYNWEIAKMFHSNIHRFNVQLNHCINMKQCAITQVLLEI